MSDRIKLVKPTDKYEKEILDFKRELSENNENDNFSGCEALEECDRISQWLDILREYRNGVYDTICDTYLVIDTSRDKMVGIIDIRHSLENDNMRLWGGHVGYTVRPSERNKGYGTKILKHGLKKFRTLNVNKVLITCTDTNIASRKVIEKNGGVFESEKLVTFYDKDGSNYTATILRYWVDIN